MILSIMITQYLVFLTWIAFRVENTESMFYAMQKYVFVDFASTGTIAFIASHKLAVALILLFMIMHYISFRRMNIVQQISNYSPIRWILFLIITMVSIFFFFNGNPEDFIYFKF